MSKYVPYLSGACNVTLYSFSLEQSRNRRLWTLSDLLDTVFYHTGAVLEVSFESVEAVIMFKSVLKE